MLRVLLLIGILLFIGCSSSGKEDSLTEVLDLSGDGWTLILDDNPDYSKPDTVVSGDPIELPNNLRFIDPNQSEVLWLRKEFNLDVNAHKKNLALVLGRIYERDEVYLNGKLIGINGKRPDDLIQNDHAYNRIRIYSIPADVLIAGTNTLSIRIQSQFRNYAGILSGATGIGYIQNSADFVFYTGLIDLVYVALFLFIGIFFFIHYLKIPEFKEYLTFSVFILIFSLFEFCKSELRFFISNNFLVFKFFEYLFLYNLPSLYLLFLQSFFKLEKLKYQNAYFFLNALIPFALLAFRQPHIWSLVISIWSFHLILPLGYSAYIAFKKVKDENKESFTFIIPFILFASGIVYFIYGVLKEILIEKGYIHVKSSIDTSLLFFILCITLALRFKFIILKLNIQKRFAQLQEFDRLREKLFQYMNKILMPYIESSLQLTRSMKADFSSYSKENLHKIESNFKEIDNSLDDILELSRLEVKEDSPLKDTVNFVDFIRTIIPEGEITYAIKVDPAFQIHNTLDMVNSLMIRIIDFNGFKNFTTKDLIVTSDLKDHLHFRFMFYQKETRKTQIIYRELNNTSMNNIQQIRWGIIKELLRLLEGKLEMSLINKKYLRVDFELQALPLEPKSVVEALGSEPKKDKWKLNLPTIKMDAILNRIKSFKKREKENEKN
jgi:hypothetical protein